jgi:hypothetical protein
MRAVTAITGYGDRRSICNQVANSRGMEPRDDYK